MIVALHVATGAAAGGASGSRVAAIVIGPLLHLAGDHVPHEDIHSAPIEIGSGLAALCLLAARRGLLDPATLGGAASSAPDLEHILPFLRPGGRKLFHDRLGWHRSGGLAVSTQVLIAAGIVGVLVSRRRNRRGGEPWEPVRAVRVRHHEDIVAEHSIVIWSDYI